MVAFKSSMLIKYEFNSCNTIQFVYNNAPNFYLLLLFQKCISFFSNYFILMINRGIKKTDNLNSYLKFDF